MQPESEARRVLFDEPGCACVGVHGDDQRPFGSRLDLQLRSLAIEAERDGDGSRGIQR
jgi:hypothetical protein